MSNTSPNYVLASPSPLSHYQQHRYGSNSELNKRTRNHSHGYELSQDLIDKQIELLERKYGGKIRAQRAALVSFLLFCEFCSENCITMRHGEFTRLRHSNMKT